MTILSIHKRVSCDLSTSKILSYYTIDNIDNDHIKWRPLYRDQRRNPYNTLVPFSVDI
jgi:hypothetical protein